MTRDYFIGVVQLFYNCYTLLILARIILSWVPSLRGYTLTRFTAFCTDPYLNLFRRVIPPVGGVLDLSPMLAFLALGFLRTALLWLIG